MPDLRLPRLMRLVRLIVPRRLSRAALVVGIALGSTLLAAHAGVGRAAAPLPAPSTSRAGAVASTAPVPLVAAWLGVHMAAASAGVRGVGVTHVVRGSPASKAGVIDGDRIVRIDEKPEVPKSRYAVTGVYFYDARVFEFIGTLKPSKRNELEITDVNNAYIAANAMQFDVLDGWWTDAGQFESLHLAATLVAADRARTSASALRD